MRRVLGNGNGQCENGETDQDRHFQAASEVSVAILAPNQQYALECADCWGQMPPLELDAGQRLGVI